MLRTTMPSFVLLLALMPVGMIEKRCGTQPKPGIPLNPNRGTPMMGVSPGSFEFQAFQGGANVAGIWK
jgi:hypothetical protein